MLKENWHLERSKQKQEELFRRALQILRFEANRCGILPKDISIANWQKKARRYKSQKNVARVFQTEIGPLEDFYNTYENQMIGDFPIYIIKQTKEQILIPSRVRDELKWLRKGSPQGIKSKSKQMRYKMEKAYFTKLGLGYIGNKYIYTEFPDLIGRKIYYPTELPYKYEILKCTGVDINDHRDSAIFYNHNHKITCNEEDLQKFGFSRIRSE